LARIMSPCEITGKCANSSQTVYSPHSVGDQKNASADGSRAWDLPIKDLCGLKSCTSNNDFGTESDPRAPRLPRGEYTPGIDGGNPAFATSQSSFVVHCRFWSHGLTGPSRVMFHECAAPMRGRSQYSPIRRQVKPRRGSIRGSPIDPLDSPKIRPTILAPDRRGQLSQEGDRPI
jgi:hypothetical protein